MLGVPSIAAHRGTSRAPAAAHLIERHGSYSGAGRTRVPTSGMQSRDDSPSNRDASPTDDTRSAAPADVAPEAPAQDGESNTRKFTRRIDCTHQVDDGQSSNFGRGRHSNNRGRHGTSLS